VRWQIGDAILERNCPERRALLIEVVVRSTSTYANKIRPASARRRTLNDELCRRRLCHHNTFRNHGSAAQGLCRRLVHISTCGTAVRRWPGYAPPACKAEHKDNECDDTYDHRQLHGAKMATDLSLCVHWHVCTQPSHNSPTNYNYYLPLIIRRQLLLLLLQLLLLLLLTPGLGRAEQKNNTF
jgi:hypothetical protein